MPICYPPFRRPLPVKPTGGNPLGGNTPGVDIGDAPNWPPAEGGLPLKGGTPVECSLTRGARIPDLGVFMPIVRIP